jgi:mannose-1-phosphate guanylyltransferase
MALIIPVILSGGAGTRLWPVSREMHPKPFMRLADGASLLQKSYNRVATLGSINEILTVTNREYYFKTKDEYAELPYPTLKNAFLLEPFGRNTAPAIGMAAFYLLEKYGPDSVMLVLPADHLIEQQAVFHQAVQLATELASAGQLVTFGIKPTSPEVGFGYIKCGDALDNINARRVAQFVEKPTRDVAEQYLASGNYLWNSGLFCFKAETILAQLALLAPDIFSAVKACWDASTQNQELPDALEIDAKTFSTVTDLSIDYAVMEKADSVAVIPCDFGWNDIGSWNAVGELVEPDASGNRVIGAALLVDSKNLFVQSEERLVAAVGVDDLVVVDTTDALLIANRNCVQDVKKIVNQLKSTNHESYKLHRTVCRPWGTYTILEEGEQFKIKRIVVKPGASLSLQMHHHRSEHWIVVSGVASVTNGEKTFTLNINESTFIPAEHQHRLENPGSVDLILIEVQTGTYLGEDDIVRFNDKYGRVREKNHA